MLLVVVPDIEMEGIEDRLPLPLDVTMCVADVNGVAVDLNVKVVVAVFSAVDECDNVFWKEEVTDTESE